MRPFLLAVAVATLGLTSGVTATAEQLHHTGSAAAGAVQPVPAPADPAQAAGGQAAVVLVPGVPTPGGCMMPMTAMMGQGGMGMMSGMMPMMSMMGGGMGMSGGAGGQGMALGGQPGMAGMAAKGMGPGSGVDHIEGRIAFVRAEVGITDAQAPAWEAFAQAVRDAAAHAGQPSMAMAGATAATQATLAQSLETEGASLATRLADVKALKDSLARLHESLGEEQRATAEALIAEILGAVVLG